MQLDTAFFDTGFGRLAMPAAAISFILPARMLTHLDLGITWLVGTVQPAGGVPVMVADLPRLLDESLPAMTTLERSSLTQLLLLAQGTPLGVGCSGYQMERGCIVRPAGRGLRGLRHFLGVAYPSEGPAIPLLHAGMALGLAHRAALASVLANNIYTATTDSVRDAPLDHRQTPTGRTDSIFDAPFLHRESDRMMEGSSR